MLERLKNLWQKIKDWWKKFTSKQKTAIVIISSVVIVALAILITVLVQPKYESVGSYDSMTEAQEVMDVLTEAGIGYEYDMTSNGIVTVKVLKESKTDAELAMGTSGLAVGGFSIEDALSGSLTTTEADKQKKYKLYTESRLESYISHYEFVKNAFVTLYVPEDSGTLVSVNRESSASINLEQDGSMTQAQANGIAMFVATALGNETTQNILITDTEGNVWFSGKTDTSMAGVLSSQADAKAAAEAILEAAACDYARGLGYVFATASASAAMDYNTRDEVTINYSAPVGSDSGLLDYEEYYEETSSGGTAGVPGTDSNGETTYVYLNNENSESSITDYSRDWLQDSTTVSTSSPATGLVATESSIAVTMTKLTYVYEDEAKRQGLLDGISWEEYQDTFVQNAYVAVTNEELQGFSNATGIPTSSITVIAREQFEFVDASGLNVDVFDVLTIVLIVVILALLAYVLWSSFRSTKRNDETEELPVEQLLQSAPPELEDIELESKSEARKLIEKFVDENPEAVSNLLRNWLNEDWG